MSPRSRVTNKTPANKTPANKTPANKTPANKTPARRSEVEVEFGAQDARREGLVHLTREEPKEKIHVSPRSRVTNKTPANKTPANKTPANKTPANKTPANKVPASGTSPAVADAALAEPDLASDLERAQRLLSLARDLLVRESEPFPVIEAGRRLKMSESSRAFQIADHARKLAGGERDDQQLSRAVLLIDTARSGSVLLAIQTLRGLDGGANALCQHLLQAPTRRSSANLSPRGST